MTSQVAVYTVVHQPRRLKLPAQPIPPGATVEDIEHCLFDEAMNERYFRQVAAKSYYPATERFLKMVRQDDFKLAIGFSMSFIKQAQQWDPTLFSMFQELVAEPNVELIGVEPYHDFQFLIDIPGFVHRMQTMRDDMQRLFGKTPAITDTTEMCMSASIYDAVEMAGFQGAVMDGREWVMGWREPTHLYNYGGNLQLLTRHLKLSDDVGYRYSNKSWAGYPLFADTYADWLRDSWGDFTFIGWDFETFGEHHWADSGIFRFIEALPGECSRRGIQFALPGEVIAQNRANSNFLPLPIFPTTWAGSGGMEFFMGNVAQQTIFQLMTQCYGVATMTENPAIIDLALWLLQSDNLHLIQWFGRTGSEAEVSAYFTPQEWWGLGSNNIIMEQQRVYYNALHAFEYYLPARQKTVKRTPAQPEPQEIGVEIRY